MLAQIAGTVQKRDRFIVLSGLLIICSLAWAYLLTSSSIMSGMEMTVPDMGTSQGRDLGLSFVMWDVMMVAMMTPSTSPMLLTFARVRRQRYPEQTPVAATLVFLLGYLVSWSPSALEPRCCRKDYGLLRCFLLRRAW